MNKIQLKIVAALCGMFAWAGCAEEVMNEEMPEPDSELCVATRGDEGKVIATPVRVYVFNSDDRCVRMEAFTESTWSFTEKLPAGDYSVYAIGGADPERLVLPALDDATKTTAITLQDGASLGDLMTASGNVTLIANGTNSLTLTMQRKVMQIDHITIKDVPDDINSVSVSITHTYKNILLNGEYADETGTFSCDLTKQDNGDWVYDTPSTYMLPSVGNPTIAVTMGPTTYSYNCTEPIEANHKLTIEGTFCDNMFNLSGTVTGASWGDNKTISFQFNSDGTSQGSSNSNPNNGEEGGGGTSANVPEVGTLYKNTYFVLAVNGNNVTLWSPTEKVITISNSDDLEKVNTELESFNILDKTGTWHLPTEAESKKIVKSISKINSITIPFNTDGYFYYDDRIEAFTSDNGYFKKISIIGNITLRPVTTITIE